MADEVKIPWYKNKKLWVAAVAVGACVAGYLGYDMDEETKQTILDLIAKILGVQG